MTASSQVVIGNIPEGILAENLVQYLEAKLGVVYKCRLKTTLPPFNANPLFSCTEPEESSRFFFTSKCPPHAFVHFASAEVAEEAAKLATTKKLVIGGHVLKLEHRSEIHTTPCWKLPDVKVQVGSLIKMSEFVVSWEGPQTGSVFELQQSGKHCYIQLSQWTLFESSELTEKAWIKCNYKLEFQVRDIWEVRKDNDMMLTFIVQFRTPPRIFYRTADDIYCFNSSMHLPDDDDPWIRTLDFTPDKSLGRCNSYRISVSPRHSSQFNKIIGYFDQQQLLKHPCRLYLPREKKSKEQRAAFYLVENHRLPFEIMFLVNAVVHKGIVKALNLTDGFYDELYRSRGKVAILALNHIYGYKTPIFDAEKRLRDVIDWIKNRESTSVDLNVSEHTIEMRRFVITPTKAYCVPSVMELSNRVLREYRHLADRFLRVSFLDENLHPLSSAMLIASVSFFGRTNGPASKTAICHRVREILRRGFSLCGRQYDFLAFSSNQLRDQSAWFFAGNGNVSAQKIRSWMGQFDKRNIAKYAARMGQCFSSTYPTVQFSDAEEIPDVLRNDYNFSDGIGKLTPALARECAAALKLETDTPSAYQIRYAGYKGVIVTWPCEDKDKRMLSLRNSMKKFLSGHETIEVITWSRYMPCFLNRQIIILLSALKVPDKVFVQLQDSMVKKLGEVLEDPKVAYEVLSSYCSGELQNTALQMLSAGFQPLGEPHLYSMIQCIRATYLEEVLSKARIYVKDGRWLLGCMDELSLLEYGQCFVQVSTPFKEDCLSEDGMTIPNTERQFKIITGTVIMAKNPCLHPGDIRILEAVDHPALHHLVDCFVMPQKGDRPHSNEASGSDLDGDVYFVCWDSSLIPPCGKSWQPMEYSADVAKGSIWHGHSRTEDLIEFFVKYMINDHLGEICNAHVVHADRSDMGALDPKCLELAELAAIAVDSPKTGRRVTMQPQLRPKAYPDFMNKADKPSYRSEKILGYLYRRVKGTAEKEIQLSVLPVSIEQFYDKDLEVDGFRKYLADAWKVKLHYDRRLMAIMDQFDVTIEGEVTSGHFTTIFLEGNSRRRGDLKERLKNTYTSLRNDFRHAFESPGNLSDDELQRKASAWYYVTYDPECRKAAMAANNGRLLLSFPWTVVEHLARIKHRKKIEYEACYRNMVKHYPGALSFEKFLSSLL